MSLSDRAPYSLDVTADLATLLELLSQRPADALLHQGVLEHAAVTSELVGKIARLSSPAVQMTIVSHPLVAPETLAFLARSRLQQISNLVVSKSSLAPEVISALARSRFADVRKKLTRHPDVASKTLVMLSFDPSAAVSQSATSALQDMSSE